MFLEILWKSLILGFTVLIVAIILNVLANLLGINTWYGFINSISVNGFLSALKKEKIISLFFMFIIYPLVLGLSVYHLFNLLK
jgi:hypothetical protein